MMKVASSRSRSLLLLLMGALIVSGAPLRVRGQQVQAPPVGLIPSLLEPGEGLAIRGRSAETGAVTFAVAEGRGVLLPGMAGTPAAERALTFADYYGRSFGIDGRQSVALLRAEAADIVGQEHVRLRQTYRGLPVTAGELLVHLKGDRVVAANGRTTSGVPDSIVPTVDASAARDSAAALMAKQRSAQAPGATYSEPRLEVFDRGLIDEGRFPTRLAWFVEANGDLLREFIWVDAQSGSVLLHFSQKAEAKNRTIYTGNNTTTLPGTQVRVEGGAATADADVNFAYDYSGVTYDYFATQHARDSYNGTGAPLRSTVHHRVNYQNAFWNGTQMVYGDGFASADDVVAHELTHAVTEFSADLFYYNQSGALNESFSDIFGETIDLLDGVGNDAPAQRWLLGEDLPPSIGAIRNMMNPNAFNDPGRMSDPLFFCRSNAYTDPNGDSGGVHINSGIPNHAYALMVDGGTYNGRTVTGIGLTKAAKVQYRALTTYLTSGSNFIDNATALSQACTDLIGTVGITSGDCTQVATAVQAVEMANQWNCPGSQPLPPPTFCPSGSPTPAFTDTFESGLGAWTVSSTTAQQWSPTTGFAAGGTTSAYGADPAATSDHRMAMTNPVVVPPNGRFYFNHTWEFEHNSTTQFYDGGVIEYSTNGTTWVDAASLIDGGANYGGTLQSTNVLGARPAFVRSSFGYTATRLNLASLAGQSVRFRFRVGTDSSVGSLGWLVDNAQLYSCGSATGPQPPTNFKVAGMSGNTVTLAWTLPTSGPTLTSVQLEGGVTPGSVLGTIPLGVTSSITLPLPTGSLYLRLRSITTGGVSGPSNEILAHIAVPVAPSAPANLLGMVSGNLLALAWTPTFAGGEPTAATLDVSGTFSLSLPLGNVDAFSFAGVPPGTYTFTVRQANGSGASAPSNPVTLTFPGACSGTPQMPANFVASKAGGLLTVAWDPPVSGAAPMSYLLNVTGAFVGAFPMAGRSLTVAPPPGSYTLSIVPTNACGTGVATAAQTVTFP